MAHVDKTFIQIVEIFETFCNEHKIIKSFRMGMPWEYGTDYLQFPNVWCVPTISTIQGTIIRQSFSFLIMDLLKKGDENLRYVWSDTQQIGYDLIAYLRKEFDELNITMLDVITMEPQKEEFDEEVTGWKFDITIELSYYADICSIPLNNPITVLSPPFITIDSFTTNDITVSWNSVDTATSYVIDVSDQNFAPATFEYQNYNVGNVTSFTAVGLNYSDSWFIRVRTVRGDEQSENSNILNINIS